MRAKPHSSFRGVSDLRMGDRWFDPQLRHYSFRGWMIVIATGFRTGKAASDLEMVLQGVILQITSKNNLRVAWIGALAGAV